MNNWPIVKFGEVLSLDLDRVEIDPTITYPMVGVYSFGRGLFDREPVHGGNTSYRNFYRLRADHIVMSQLFGWEGALALSSTEFSGKFVSPQFPTFVANEEKLDRRYLGWYIRRPPFWEELGTRTRGMGDRRRTLNPDALFSCEIPLPPLSEQRRIVAKIEQLATKIDSANAIRRNSQHESEFFFTSRLKEFRVRSLSNFPSENLGAITTITAGGTPSREVSSYWNGDIPWIKTGELLDGDIATADEHITQAGLENSSAKLFPNDTILIALYGQGQTRGRTGRLVFEAATNQACCAILPTPERLEPRYTQYWLRSLYYELREVAHGGAQPNWNSKMIKMVRIALPSLDEQRRIVAYLDGLQAQVDRLKALQAQTAAELEALLPSILDKAFKGELCW